MNIAQQDRQERSKIDLTNDAKYKPVVMAVDQRADARE